MPPKKKDAGHGHPTLSSMMAGSPKLPNEEAPTLKQEEEHEEGAAVADKASLLEVKALSAIDWTSVREVMMRDGTGLVTTMPEAILLSKELVRFLVIKAMDGDFSATKYSPPTTLLDQAWHTLLLFPALYFKLSHELCGKVIDHNPMGGDDVAARTIRRDAVRERYQVCFQHIAPKLQWGELPNSMRVVGEKRKERDESPADSSAPPPSTTRGKNGAQPDSQVKFSCVTADGQQTYFIMKRDTTTLKLRRAFQDKLGIGNQSFRMLYDGVGLHGAETLGGLGVEDDDVIDVMIEAKGC